MNNIERDEERIKAYYGWSNVEGCEFFSSGWFCRRWDYLEAFKDISEEFHRKYWGFYYSRDRSTILLYHTCLSEKFYEDFFDKMTLSNIVDIIKTGKVSTEWVERNKHRISPVVWEKVYE
jgi:hypothetical protein